MKDRWILIAGGLVTVFLLFAGWLMLPGKSADAEFAQCRKAVVAGGIGNLGAPFELTSETGARIKDTDVFTKPTLLYFGYSYCPDVCPIDSARNAQAVDDLAERGIDAQTVFLTVDPRRDTPERLTEYTDGLHPDMLGLTGSDAEIDQVAKAWSFYYKRNDETDKLDYSVDHQTTTYLVLPGHGTVDFFGRATTPEEMADTVQCYVNAAG